MKGTPRDRSIGAQMYVALQLMKRRNQKIIKDHGFNITMEQLAVLEILHFKGEMNMTELSTELWKQNANITRIVDKIEKKGFVVRKPVEGDRRAFLLCITKEGSQIFKNTIPLILKEVKGLTSCLTKEEHDITIASIKKIIAHIA